MSLNSAFRFTSVWVTIFLKRPLRLIGLVQGLHYTFNAGPSLGSFLLLPCVIPILQLSVCRSRPPHVLQQITDGVDVGASNQTNDSLQWTLASSDGWTKGYTTFGHTAVSMTWFLISYFYYFSHFLHIFLLNFVLFWWGLQAQRVNTKGSRFMIWKRHIE